MTNIEIKARYENAERAEENLNALGAGLARRPWVALLPIAVGLALSFGLLSVRFEDRVIASLMRGGCIQFN